MLLNTQRDFSLEDFRNLLCLTKLLNLGNLIKVLLALPGSRGDFR